MRTHWFLSMIAATLCAALAAEENPVTNGGFEVLETNGFPQDWCPYVPKDLIKEGEGLVDVSNDAHSGKHSIRLKLSAKDGAVGLNRIGKPKGAEGAAKMLTQLKGGIEFYYKALGLAEGGGRLSLNVIPMKADGIEGGGRRSTYVIPAEHVGDGQWHRWVQKYDYTDREDVKYIQVCPRIHNGSGEILFDDIAYLPKVGPMVALVGGQLREIGGQEGKKGVVTYTIENAGDARAEGIRCRLAAPAYLKLIPGIEQVLPRIEAGGKESVSWVIEGERSRTDRLVFEAEGGGGPKLSRAMALEPNVVIDSVTPERFIVTTTDEFGMTCTVGNKGTANAPGVKLALFPSAELRLKEGEMAERTVDVPAGGTAKVTWGLVGRTEGRDAAAIVKMESGGSVHEAAAPRMVVITPYLREECVALGNEHVRLAFPKSPFGYGVVTIDVFDGQKWVRAGAMPRLGRCVWLTDAGDRVEQAVYSPELQKGISNVVFKQTFTDSDNRTWTVETVFSIAAGRHFVNVESQLKCDNDAKLLCFEGPMVYAGEGSFGSAKSDALFAGLEWLVGDEISSSTLDIETPDHIRYVPHPNKITIPVMAVRHAGTLLGIMWDARGKWTDQELVIGEERTESGAAKPVISKGGDRVCAVFASPNAFESTASHLMGLFAPTVPVWVQENLREAHAPFPLKKDWPVKIEMRVIGYGDAPDCLTAVDCWFDANGVPDPMPIPRGSYEKEFAFSMDAYLATLWIPEQKKWWSSICPNPLIQHEVMSPDFCMDLAMGSRVVPDGELRRACLKRLEEVMPLLGRNVGLGFSYYVGNVEAMTRGAAGAALNLIRSQGPEGEWRFNAHRIGTGVFEGMDYSLLGPNNAVEVGTCAANAKRLLTFARMTGDEASRAAGLKALSFMKQFDVPRAAQVWEIPVHTPDVLASAFASHAYLEGYRITGNRQYLSESVRWARTGLPFIYFWNVDEFPFMRYGSIPVYGATWFRGSWFGRPVQWNGLEYALALFDLSEHDKSFPWRTVAEGLTISALHQQSTDREKDYTLWPDSISAIDAKKSAWVFAPHRVLVCLGKMLGRPYDPPTTIIRTPQGMVHVTGPARVTQALLDETGKLDLRVDHAAGGRYYTSIAPIARPSKVVKDKIELPCVEALEECKGDGWRYTPSLGMLVIASSRGGISQIEIEGVKPNPISIIPKVKKDLSFLFDAGDDAEGWQPAHHIEEMKAGDGALTMKIAGGDPYMIRENIDVANPPARLIVRLRANKDGGGQIFWCTEDSPGWGEDKRVNFAVKGDGQFHDYEIDMASHAQWQGKHITAIRIDPLSGDHIEGAEVAIDFVKTK